MSISSLLDRKLSIQRPTITRDASGGAARTFATILANVPCAIAPATAKIASDYARRDMVVDHHVYTTTNLDTAMPAGLQLGDRFADGAAYYLVKAIKRTANQLVSSEVMYQDCERIG
jgi:hypothetical protein